MHCKSMMPALLYEKPWVEITQFECLYYKAFAEFLSVLIWLSVKICQPLLEVLITCIVSNAVHKDL